MLSGLKVGVGRLLAPACIGLEQFVVFDGVVDAGGGQQGVELAPGGGGVVLGQDGFDDGLRLARASPGLGFALPSGLK
jgi:hypothetical protein